MNFIESLKEIIEKPEVLSQEKIPAGFAVFGMLGYILGILGLFVYLRLYVPIMPGVISTISFLILVIAFEFLFASTLHMIMDLTGMKGKASAIFFAFGGSDFVLTMMVPVAFITEINPTLGYLSFLMVMVATLSVRVKLVRLIYPVSTNRAVFTLWLPCCAFLGLMLGAFVYITFWGMWILFEL